MEVLKYSYPSPLFPFPFPSQPFCPLSDGSAHDVNPTKLLFQGFVLDKVANSSNRRPSTIPIVAVVSMGSMYLGLKTRTVMARQGRGDQGEERNYQVDTHRSGKFLWGFDRRGGDGADEGIGGGV